jgi:hypothetical protein
MTPPVSTVARCRKPIFRYVHAYRISVLLPVGSMPMTAELFPI